MLKEGAIVRDLYRGGDCPDGFFYGSVYFNSGSKVIGIALMVLVKKLRI